MKPKAKPKRISKQNVVQPIEEVEEPPFEEVKTKKRASKKNNIVVEDIKPVEPVEPVVEDIEEIPKNIKNLRDGSV